MTGAELIGIVAISGTTLSAILTTLFHSRCSYIKCWGVECKRDVLSEEQLNRDNERINNQE